VFARSLSRAHELKAVISFHVSGLVREVFDGKKPYNPILGETCAWAYQHSDPACGVTRMVCEQVSHHPPISGICVYVACVRESVHVCVFVCARAQKLCFYVCMCMYYMHYMHIRTHKEM